MSEASLELTQGAFAENTAFAGEKIIKSWFTGLGFGV